MPVIDMGMVSYGLYLPEGFETAEEIAEASGLSLEAVARLGIEKKCRPGKDDHPVAMAEKAARTALDQAGSIDPLDVDVVIWTGEEYKDYVAQTAAIRIQESVGCRRAFAYDLVGQGTTLILGLRVARDMMAGDESIRTILLAGGTRNVDLVDYTRSDTRFLLPYSASGGAVILQKDHHRHHILAIDVQVDADMADEIFVPGGGTEVPFDPDNLNSDLMFYQAAHPEKLEAYLAETWPRALEAGIDRILGDRRPDYLALRHLPPDHRNRILARFNLDDRRSAPLTRFGHHGPNDTLISLDVALKNGDINDGDLVVMASSGIGFTYGSALLKW